MVFFMKQQQKIFQGSRLDSCIFETTEKIRIDYVRQGIRHGSRFPEDGIFMDTLAAKDRLDQDKWRAGKQSP